METPIYTHLEDYHKKGRISFAMPGHKNLRGLAPDLQKCDVTELSATVDLHHRDKTVKKAEELLSKLYKSRASYIMTNGSTAGVQTMLTSVLEPGDTVLASADCHMSVINTCAVCGFKLKIIPAKYDTEFLIPTDIKEITITDDIKAVIVTSPNYYGVVKNIKEIAQICHKKGIPLLVDEAHGAHFIASKEFPNSAVECGADIVCQSAHKTLNALTGAAYLHLMSDDISVVRVERALRTFQTSSPSYPIAASADAARATLETLNYDDIIEECSQFKNAIIRATEIKALINNDITRIVLNFGKYETTGFAVEERLSQYYGIDIEMADCYNIVLIVTPWNTHSDFMDLFSALRDITGMYKKSERQPEFILPPEIDDITEPQKAWFAKTHEIELIKAEGEISAATITPYPPGTGVIMPGSRINRNQIEYINALKDKGAKITGITDGKIEVVRWTE